MGWFWYGLNMARHLRCNVRDGWYHITTRGVGRREIFDDDRDRGHFVELLGELVARYGVILHAYVLMDNHYHLLLETPQGNASRAMQWLNVSYAAWYNARHQRAGQLFQGRYKGIPIQREGAWALTCSIYLHLNPVRIQSLGLGKAARAAEKAGAMPAPPDRALIERRLAKLRSYHWSSYPAYAGYTRASEWLTRETIWQRVARRREDAAAAYRHELEDYLKQGIEEGAVVRLTQALAIGSTAFVEKLRNQLTGASGDRTNVRAWRRLLPFAEIVRAVETVRAASWADFAVWRGDWGRDLVLYVARMHGGMTLAEIARHAGMKLDTVNKSVLRMRQRIKKEASMKRKHAKVMKTLVAGKGVS